jgi:hypothetical protein
MLLRRQLTLCPLRNCLLLLIAFPLLVPQTLRMTMSMLLWEVLNLNVKMSFHPVQHLIVIDFVRHSCLLKLLVT